MNKSLGGYLNNMLNYPPGLIGCLFCIAGVLFINVWFVLGYIVGTSTGKNYDNQFVFNVDTYHILGCSIGLIVGWLIKSIIQGF